MHWHRLFHALVVQGAVLTVACDGEDATGDDDTADEPPTTDASASGDAEDDADPPDDGAATSGAPDPSGPMPMSTGAGDSATDDGDPRPAESTGSATGEGDGATTSSGPNVPEGCSEEPLPDDPCGCPCCWALDCANDDEACCAGFTQFCTPP